MKLVDTEPLRLLYGTRCFNQKDPQILLHFPAHSMSILPRNSLLNGRFTHIFDIFQFLSYFETRNYNIVLYGFGFHI